jgi:hypothetical protein
MRIFYALVLLCLILPLSGCGGGGGSEGETENTTASTDTTDTTINADTATETESVPIALRYDGNTELAVVTTTNAKSLVEEFFGGYDSTSTLSEDFLFTNSKTVSSISGTTVALSQASKDLMAILPTTQQNIDLVSNCKLSGSLHVTGVVTNENTGEFILAYDQCDKGDVYYDGIAYVSIITYDETNGVFTTASMSFDFLHAKGDFGDIYAKGSIYMLLDPVAITEVSRSNIIFQDNLTNAFSKVENLVIRLAVDSLSSPSRAAVSYNGKLYDQNEGYVIVTSDDVLAYNDPVVNYPYDGGPLRMTGASYYSLWVTPLSATELIIEVDIDGDGIYDASTETEWPDMDDEFIDRNIIPIADAGDDLSTAVGEVATLDGTGSQDPDGDTLYYNWSLIEAPDGSASASLTESNAAVAHFTAGSPGTYTISLVVNDGIDYSVSSTVLVNAYDIHGLEYRVIDAEYSPRHDSIVMVSDTPPAVHIYDARTNTTQTLPLDHTPTSVSVSPYGWRAAVGHDGSITIVDLDTPALLNYLTVSTDVFDLVMSEFGYVYVLPRFAETPYILAVQISTGIQTPSTGHNIDSETKAKLSHDDKAIYSANSVQTPMEIDKFSVQDGKPVYLYDSPYTDEYAICGDLWLAEYGKTIFTKCGNVFRASIIEDLDMTYRGTLDTANNMILHADHSWEANRVAVILEADAEVHMFDSSYLTLQHIIGIPQHESNGLMYPLHGRYVFYTENGQHVNLVVQGDPAAGLSDEYFVVRY